MADTLADAFRSELPCDAASAAALAARARAVLPRLAGSAEDSDEDLVVRLRDPRSFGAFAEVVLSEGGLPPVLRRAVAEHAFDLLSLPRTEGEIFDISSRAPPTLLSLARVLVEDDALTVLHVMHLVYAVFLDRSLITGAPRQTRSDVLRGVIHQPDSEESLATLYACLHLASVPEAEASSELRRMLRARGAGPAVQNAVAALAASDDGGRASLARLAQREGLIAQDAEGPQAPGVLANIPRLPSRLAAPSQRFLKRSRSR